MATKKKDSSKFEGNGISFKAKLIGTEEVPEARGDLLCQEAITKLKNVVKTSGQHKQKIYINVTLEGLKIIDAVSLTNAQNKKKSADTRSSKTSVDSEEAVKTDEMLVLHTHPVHRISFISRDTTDNRAFGYIIGAGEGNHTFFAIKTAAAAEQIVLTLRDLFQVVYELKKKEVDEAKEKIEGGENANEETDAENSKPSGEGSTSEESQTQKTAQAADADGIYHVPPNNAPVNGSLEEQQANLLDLEDQADSILKGIEQIKNLEFDSITSDGDKSPSSPPMSPPVFKPGTADPWAVPATTTPAASTPANSNLGDLAGIQTGPFVNMHQQQPGFPGNFPGQMPAGYNVSAVPGYNMGNAGLPVTQNPFGNDPFAANRFQQPGMRPAGFGAAPANPFGSGAAFGQQPFLPPVPGMFPAAAANANQNPFAANPAAAQEDPNLLKPIRNDQQGVELPMQQGQTKPPKEDLFGDLLGIKKSTTAAKSPKDMFAQLNTQDKKSMNQLKVAADMPPKASFDDMLDPFLNEGENVSEDKTRGLIPSEGEDPFDMSHIPFSSTAPPTSTSINAPPLPQRLSPEQSQQLAIESNNPNNLQPKSLLPSSSSSSSSLSSSSNQPSLLPPPPPSRIKNNPSPSTLPSTLLSLSGDCNKQSDLSNSFVLPPSPDEPPPPLPQDFINSRAAPPPPPRPSSSKSLLSVSSHGNTQKNPSPVLSPNEHEFSSEQTSSSSSLSSSSPFSDPQPKPNTNVNNFPSPSKSGKSSKSILKFDLSFKGDTDSDPFSVPFKSSSSNHNESSSKSKRNNNSNKNNNNNHSNKNNNNNMTGELEDSSFDTDFDLIRTTEKKQNSSSKPTAVDSSPPSSNNNTFSSPEKIGDIDPFGLPLHLTPGFKAVARFGNDPFEDSFGASSTNNTSEQELMAKWDPFPDTPSPFENPASSTSSKLNNSDPWNTNAFGDVFAPPTNNNNS